MDFFRMIAGIFGFSRKEARILVVGLDNSGKTTLVNHLKPKKGVVETEVTPTVGFQVEEFSQNNVHFTVYDMSGQGRYRSLWEHYYTDVQAIIFVLDSTDKFRLCVAAEELNSLLSHESIKNSDKPIPILFYANKMDVPGALTAEECMSELKLDSLLRDKDWHITDSKATTGEGVQDGIEWLCSRLSRAGRK